MGLLELYNIQRGGKLKHLGSQITHHFIVSLSPYISEFFFLGKRGAFYLGADKK
jgi:hypothetical protein